MIQKIMPVGENDYKKILNTKNNKSIFFNSINANTESNSLFTNDSKYDNYINPNSKEKEKEIKKNIIDDSISKERNEYRYFTE